MKIVVIGMGYVGIPAAALFADVPGFEVTGIQRRSKRSGWKIEYLNQGKNPIGGDEPGLAELIHRVVIEKKTFHVTDDMSPISEADAILIDVQTPTDQHRIPRYLSLREVSAEVGKRMKKGAMVVIESTCAPGTTDYIVKPILEEHSGMTAGKDFYLVFAYERVMVGRLLHNITDLPRIVGGINEESTRKGVELYKKIVKAPIYPTTALTAEVAKTVENTYRDVNIAFANEVALACESLGIDVFEVRKLVNTLPNDPSNPKANPVRNMHFPGAGVGGHCLPKDPWLLKYGVDTYGKKRVKFNIIVNSRELNDYMPHHMVELVRDLLNEHEMSVKGKKITILGIAFLENSDDTRNTPTLPIYTELKKLGAQVVVHDPLVKEFEDVNLTQNLEDALTGTDCIVLVTAHDEYRKIEFERIKNMVRTPLLVDGRNFFEPERIKKAGFSFRYLGKRRKSNELSND